MNQTIYHTRMAAVMARIENQLDQKLSVSELASIACYSEFHFHRLFRAYYGESIYAYQKRLLLERAVKQLCYTTAPVTEIAFNAGYDNSSSFNKAFLKCFAKTPTQVRGQNLAVRAKSINFANQLCEEITMTPQIKHLDSTTVLCTRSTGHYKQAASEAWSTLMSFAYSNKLMIKQTRLFGISHDDPAVTESDKIRYDACISQEASLASEIELQQGIERKVIAGGKHAIFLHQGPHDNLADSYRHIFSHWLPNSGYELKDAPCFECYLNRDPRRTKPENLKTEIYIPLQ